jgi:hypothetical protein
MRTQTLVGLLAGGFVLYMMMPKGEGSEPEFAKCLDDNMPPDERAVANDLLGQKFSTPGDYDRLMAVAVMAEQKNMPLFAACLREKARLLKASLR